MSKNNEPAIEKIIRLMQTDRSVNAPEDSIQWSKNIFRARATAPRKTLVEKVRAVLQLDLSGAKPAFGERSASAAKTRQMLFGAGEDNSIDLRIDAAGENVFSIHGQILGEGFAGCTVKLGEFETEANDLSEFKIKEIPHGTYDLILQSGEREIVVEGLEFN